VIILTGRSTVVDKITGLEVGADDYLTKPLIRGNWWRVSGGAPAQAVLGVPSPTLKTMGLKSARIAARCGSSGTAIAMTPKEIDLLLMMVSKRGAVISREEIGQVIWGKSPKSPARTSDTPTFCGCASKPGRFRSDRIEKPSERTATASIPNYYFGGFWVLMYSSIARTVLSQPF